MASAVIFALAALATSGAVGRWVVSAAGMPRGARGAGRVLRIALAFGIGLGMTSVFTFLWALCFGLGRGTVVLGDVVLGAGAWAVARWRRPLVWPAPAAAGPAARWWLWSVVGVMAVAALASLIATAVELPHGNGDAIGIWNLRARFLHEAFGEWDLVLCAQGLAHVDYPLLLPCGVVRGWLYAGERTALWPLVFGVAMLASTVAAVGAAVALRRGSAAGALAAVALLGTPFLVRHGAEQAADVAVAFFASAALIGVLTQLSALAGLAAGCAAFTKDEGLLFAAALLGWAVVSAGWCRWRGGGGALRARAAVEVAAGALLPCLAVVLFKVWLAPASDLLAAGTDGAAIAARLAEPDRYRQVASAALARVYRLSTEGEWGGMGYLWLGAYALCVGRAPDWRRAWRWLPVPLAVVAAFLLYFVAVSPHNLDWHLRTALGRLLLQPWPAIVLLVVSGTAVPALCARRR